MSKNKKKKEENKIFNGIRKKTAPCSIKMKNKKRSKKQDAVGRNEKHKKSTEI